MSEPTFPMRVMRLTHEAIDVLSIELERTDGVPVETIDPGAHVEILLPNGLARSYSLSNSSGNERGYRVTVARDAASRGGSAYIHESLRVGAVLQVSAPRNNFELVEDAAQSVFIAGGIGVTPFLPMAAKLNAAGRRWTLHYCVRTQDRAALLGELSDLTEYGQGELRPNFDQEPGGAMLDIAAVLAAATDETHFYCCGPAPMLDAYRAAAAAAGIASDRVHFEYFAGDVTAATEGGFSVRLVKSGKTVTVSEGQTILQAVLEAGVDIQYSCEEGVCGACETVVLEGQPDHRDLILSDSERAASRTMMICCSGSKSAELALDL